MSMKWYRPSCECYSKGSKIGSETCRLCGKPAQFGHWGYSRVEAMDAYQRFWKISPLGPHRPVADKLLAGLSESCSSCGGHGVLGIDVSSCAMCADCNGTGRRLIADEGALERVGETIREQFPSSVV